MDQDSSNKDEEVGNDDKSELGVDERAFLEKEINRLPESDEALSLQEDHLKNKKTEEQKTEPITKAEEQTFFRSPKEEKQRKAAYSRKRKAYRKALYSFLFIFGLILINLLLIYPIFSGSSPSFLDSGEAQYVSISKYILDNFPSHSWNPQAYAGFPFHISFSPLLAYLVAVIKSILGFLSFITIYRVIAGLFFLIGPVSLYLFVKYITKKEFTALVAALLYSMPPFLLLFLDNVQDAFTKFGSLSWQTIALSRYGDFPHLIAIGLLPLTLLLFLYTIRQPNLRYYIITAIMVVVISLINWVSLTAFVLIALGLLFSEVVLGKIGSKIRTAFIILCISVGLGAFFHNFAFLQSAFDYADGRELVNSLIGLVPLGFAVVPIVGTALFLAFDRKRRWQPYLIGIVWCLIFFVILSLGQYTQRLVYPHPERFILEFWMGISILVSVLITSLMTIIRRLFYKKLAPNRIHFMVTAIVVITLGVLVALVSFPVQRSQDMVKPLDDLEKTSEYQVSRWLSQQSDSQVRVYASDNLALWLNVFSEVPQAGGGLGWGAISPVWKYAVDEINRGSNGAITGQWLEIFNVEYIAVGPGLHRKEIFDILVPEKFNELVIRFLS